jgi:hypothetical protein
VASKSLVKWQKMSWENWRASAWGDLSRVVLCFVVCRGPFPSPCPLRPGGSSSFYRPRRERITCMPRYLATWGSVVCYVVE